MTGREKIEAAFAPGGTPEIPVVICYEGIFNRDHWAQLTSWPWWCRFSPDIEQQFAMYSDIIRATEQDWFVLPWFYSREERRHVRIEVRPDGVFRVNERTGREERLNEPQVGGWSREGGLHSRRPERMAVTTEQVDEIVTLAPDSEPVMPEGCDDLARLLIREFSDKFPICHAVAPLWGCYFVWGFEGMMTMVAERPELVEHACSRFVARARRSLKAIAALGARGVWIEDCMCDMVSAAAFERLALPFLREICDEIRRHGMKSIYYFCGNPAGKWDLLFATGADALSLEESKKGFDVDIEDVVRRAGGRCTVLGNLDAINLLPNASEKELRAEVKRQIEAGRRNGSRFIMSLGSPVTPGTSVERVRFYCNLVRELGR
jgi:uroporphyrinogen-III decarboxylase